MAPKSKEKKKEKKESGGEKKKKTEGAEKKEKKSKEKKEEKKKKKSKEEKKEDSPEEGAAAAPELDDEGCGTHGERDDIDDGETDMKDEDVNRSDERRASKDQNNLLVPGDRNADEIGGAVSPYKQPVLSISVATKITKAKEKLAEAQEAEKETLKQKEKEKVNEKEEQPKEKKKERVKEKVKDSPKVTPKSESKSKSEKGNSNEKEKEKEKKKEKKKDIVSILGDASLAELEEMPELLEELHLLLEQQRVEVNEFSDIVDVVDAAVNDLEQRHAGHGCQLVWKVDGFYSKFKEAKNKMKPIVFSPMFDTHPQGYRLALSLCPNGDGRFRGQFMSIFFCLLKGEHDSLQTWPFCLPVTVSLVSQAKQPQERVDHVAIFTPNPVMENKAFLGRPTASRNPSLGFPKFIAIDELWEDEFVANDEVFIKVQVDTTDVIRI